MLPKWKFIINNWINCYFDESNQDVRQVNIDSLLTIISHLRENLNLDESKSSALEAHTVEDFILEKYPAFKFNNGTVKASNEDETYLVASLLLFFVCVNSKNMDIKSAMCSKLSVDDQEIIMKFSKLLMECSFIACEDIQTAITEACGNDVANIDAGHLRLAVAETPPALRSLHGEVRRLQAALDAERFDRNFLQEELARTNLRLEKLSKDKEQYKLEIMDLKTKISLCCRGDHDARQMESSEKQSSKLARQLQDMEERLIKTQEQLEEAVYEKDNLKAKIEGLKQDRDKWLNLSQQESARAVQLSEELETERGQLLSLKELVIELRQHNRLNKLDSSLLECDDPDASIQSLGRNLSLCSEACANVIEVQLSEERAKVDALKQQIQTLQKENEQLHFAIEEDNSNHEVIVKEKDCIIDNLEKQLKAKNTLLESLQKDHEEVTLSWEKHKLKTREIIEVKEERIRKLSEHLGSLKQEFADLEDVNRELTEKIDMIIEESADLEKKYKEKLLEGNLAMTVLLNDKESLAVENNSLKQGMLELKTVQELLLNDKQFLMAEKETLVESLQVEKSARDAIENEKEGLCLKLKEFNEHHASEINSKQVQLENITEDMKRLQIKFEDLRELFKQMTVILNAGLDKLIEDFKKDNGIKKILQNVINFDNNQVSSADKCDLILSIAKKLYTTVIMKKKELHHSNTALKSQKATIKQREQEILELQNNNKQLQETISDINNELSKQNETFTNTLDEKFKEIQLLQQGNQSLTNELNTVKIQMELKVHSLKEKLVDSENQMDDLKKNYECQIENLNIMVTKLTEHLKAKTYEIQITVRDRDQLQQCIEENKKAIRALEEQLKAKVQDLETVTNDFESEKLVLKNMLTVTESVMEDHKISLNNTITELTNKNIVLQDEIRGIKEQRLNEKTNLELEIREKQLSLETIQKELVELKIQKQFIEKEKATTDKELMSLKSDFIKKENEIIKANEEHKAMQSLIEEKVTLLLGDINIKEEEIKKVLLEKNALENVIRNYEENVFTSLEKQNTELKIEIDALEIEHHTKVDTLTELLQKERENNKDLHIQINKKSETVTDMENKVQNLEAELNTLKEEKSKLMDEKNYLLATINELEEKSFRNAELIKTLQDDNMKVQEIISKISEDKMKLEQHIDILKKEKGEFEHTIANLNTDIIELNQNILVIKTSNSALQEDVTKLKDANTQLEEDTVKLNQDNMKSKEDMDNLDKLNAELAGQIKKFEKEYNELANTIIKEKNAREEQDKEISNILSSGVTKLLQEFQKEGITNETIQQLINSDKNDTSTVDKCDMLINIANMVTVEAIMRKNLEKALEHEDAALLELRKVLQQKEMQISELQTETKQLQQVISENKIEFLKQNDMHATELDKKTRELQIIQQDNASLTNDLNDVKIQLEVKVHSLKEKLVDNENLTDKLKRTYECQIDNLNIMITKLTNYLKSNELEVVRKEKDRLQQVLEINNKAIKSLEEEIKNEKLSQEKLMNDFESERQVIKNMVAVTESVMEDQKVIFKNTILEKDKTIEMLDEEKITLSNERNELELKLQEKETALALTQNEIIELRLEKENLEKEITLLKETSHKDITALQGEIQIKEDEVMQLKENNNQLEIINKNYKDSAESLANENSELKIKKDAIEVEFRDKVEKLTESLQEQIDNKKDLNIELNDKTSRVLELEDKIKHLETKINSLEQEKTDLIKESDSNVNKVNEIQSLFETYKLKADKETTRLTKDKTELLEEIDNIKTNNKELEADIHKLTQFITNLKEQIAKLQEDNALQSEEVIKLRTENEKLTAEVTKLTNDNMKMVATIEEKKADITNLEMTIQSEQERYKNLELDLAIEKTVVSNKNDKQKELEERQQKEILSLQKELQTLKASFELCMTESVAKDGLISKMSKEKNVIINNINKELLQEKALREKYQNDLEEKNTIISELKKDLNDMNNEKEALKIITEENELLLKAVGQRETFAVRSQENASSRKFSGQLAEKELRDIHHQVDNTSDITHSSIESLKTITDLEKIVYDKNRTITTLQSDITYLKSLMGESENKLLDVTKELEVSKENCQQLSSQLKKIVHQKNEEIAELKKQVTKMSVTENRATQIIKVSAKYQAIILKRIAEIKSNTVLKELTNFGNSNTTCDNELRRSLNAGTITMEDLENFLETTEKHLKRCSERQLTLQKEKDRLTEVNRINESEIINLKKFLTELSVRFQTFSSVKDLYAQKLSRVISVQRTVRREILNLDGHVTEECMLKLERGYAAVMQDLAECAMNLERWVERCIARTISTEKIKQAFLNEDERTSFAPSSIQNVGLEVQLDELENSFQRLLEEVSRAPQGEGARDAQAVTLMEVRAEYEDKLNRMKAKMKQLYTEQIAVFKEKQKKEIAMLERELERARDTLSKSSRAYEDHIRGLTTELWSVGEKFLVQKDEAKYLRRKQQSGSLMSLQHVHSSGLVPTLEEPGRSSDSQSLRSLPAINNGGTKREGRGLHVSDEEGEVFDNRYLQELATPRRAGGPGRAEGRETGPPERLSELRWRNSLCPPHLKSSYPAETQFTHAIDEDEIKAMGAAAGRPQRKEVGIIAYKKPGPPTPSKQAGRLSATDSELRESLRVETEPQPSRKTSTPSRIRSLFRSSKVETTEGTPRSRRLSNIFRKK
ncbi:unnamed protein product [Arctia plantaginis]|uniref:Uncharacterized protein n=1 Tax=Arctia plantaginis TaxID=874455 RepID=A0A8S1ABN6_ARCPL|nr:unnamed protein product [Arctia plantaginis]